jgi:hypothetical protein
LFHHFVAVQPGLERKRRGCPQWHCDAKLHYFVENLRFSARFFSVILLRGLAFCSRDTPAGAMLRAGGPTFCHNYFCIVWEICKFEPEVARGGVLPGGDKTTILNPRRGQTLARARESAGAAML